MRRIGSAIRLATDGTLSDPSSACALARNGMLLVVTTSLGRHWLSLDNSMVLQIVIHPMIEIGELFEEGHKRLAEEALQDAAHPGAA
jgi:hypothetical protein